MPTRSPTSKLRDTFADRFDATDNFVSENQRQFWLRQFAINDVQIRPANRAGGDADENLIRRRLRCSDLSRYERLADFFEQHRAHYDLYGRVHARASSRND